MALVASPGPGSGREWARRAAELEDAGWPTLLVPDTLNTLSPFPALAAAAAVTQRIRLRPWVLAAPLRTPGATLREASTLMDLSEGRLELGLGAGRPGGGQADAEALGVSWPDAPARIAAVEEVAALVRSEVRPGPAIAVAASGPRMLAAAGRILADPRGTERDRLVLALPPTVDREGLVQAVTRARKAGPGAGVSITVSLVGVGGKVSPGFNRWSRMSEDDLSRIGSFAVLPPDPDEAVDELLTWTGDLGIDEVTVPADLADAAAPLLSRLAAPEPMR